MSQTITDRRADEQSENCPPSNETTSGSKEEGKKGAILVETLCSDNRVERFLVVFLALKLDNIRDRAGQAATNEVINILHQENFNLSVFKEMIKSSGYFQVITQDVIERIVRLI